MSSFELAGAFARRAAVVTSFAFATVLGGCGGGGGDGPVASILPAPAKAAKVAVGGTTLNSIGLSGLYTNITSDGKSYKVSDRSPVGGNAATLTDPDPVTGEQKFTVAGKLAHGAAVSNATGLVQVPSAAFYKLQGATPSGATATLIEIPNASRHDPSILLTSSGYGVYTTAAEAVPTGKGVTFAYVFGGNPTTAADMRKNVTATYSGAFAGQAFAASATPTAANPPYSRGLTADVGLTLNASAGTVQGNVYNMTAYNSANGTSADAGFGLAIDAKIDPTTGNTYQGSVNFTNAATKTGGAAVVGATQSNVIGGFYGPGAAETAGALQVQGKAPGAGLPNDLFVTGSYGAKKQ
jgi:C-lobe and N-lobe beta barrels of Tf-binding protein B